MVRVEDPWALHGTPPIVAATVAASYGGVHAALERRALVYHAIGPWHEVLHGLRGGDPGWVESGLRGLRDRLAKVSR